MEKYKVELHRHGVGTGQTISGTIQTTYIDFLKEAHLSNNEIRGEKIFPDLDGRFIATSRVEEHKLGEISHHKEATIEVTARGLVTYRGGEFTKFLVELVKD